MAFKQFKQSQKFRIINGSACFYATAKEIRAGLGDLAQFNAATQKALCALEFSKSERSVVSGLCGTWEGLQIQIDKVQ
jgi:hypothetical protein